MDNLVIEKSKSTFGVNFNSETGELLMEGSSFPENASDFFNPLVNWLQQYMLEVTGKITLNIRFDYLNSSSIKFVSDIIDKLDFFAKSGADMEINWYYEEDDEDIEEMGDELKDEVSFPFNLIVK